MRELWKIFFCGFVALIVSVFIYLNIKDILPFPIIILLAIFVLVYAGATHLVKY